jgi:hypothetical protein
MSIRRIVVVILVSLGALGAARTVAAATIAIDALAFGVGSTLTTFTGQLNGAEVNGVTVDGILFQYSLGSGNVIFDGGPGVTNNITPPNIVSNFGSNSGILSVTLPSAIDQFGYGFAILTTSAVPTATTISLFSGATPVGSLSYPGAPDPFFSGGFAGIQSTLPFNRVEVTFNSSVAPAFALDNVRTSTTAVPEPGTMLLLATGLGALCTRRRRN